MRPNQRRGQRARKIPSVADINRRAEEPRRPRHPNMDIDRDRVQHRHTQSLPQQYGFQHHGEYLMQNNPNTHQDGHRRYHSSVTGRIGPHAPDGILTPSLHNHRGISTHVQHGDPRYPCPQCTESQYPGPQYPGPQYPGLQYPGPLSAVPQQIHGLDSTYRPRTDENGIPRVNDYFPPLQEVFGRLPPTYNDQMFAGPPEPQAGIPNSMAPFDSTSFQQGYNAPYFPPNLGYGGSSHEQGVSPGPFRSLLTTPYLLPAPLPGPPTLQLAVPQGSYQFSSEALSSSATTHEQTRSRAASNQRGNLHKDQTTVDPRDLSIVQHDLGGPPTQSKDHAAPQNERNVHLNHEQSGGNINRSSRSLRDDQSPVLQHPRTPRQSLPNPSPPADQTPNIGKRHGAKDLPASAVSDLQSELTHLVPQQQLQTHTRPRIPHHQGESYDNQGQGSEKRKRREHSSPEVGSSPSTSAQTTEPRNDIRDYFRPQQEEQTPTRTQTGKYQNQIRRLRVLRPSQSESIPNLPSDDRGDGAGVDLETLDTATEPVGTGQQKPFPCDTCGKRYGSSKSLQNHYRQYCKRRDKRRHRKQTLNSAEAGSGLVMTDHERPAEVMNRVLSEGVPHYNQSGNENGEQQLVDNAQNSSSLAQDPGAPTTPPNRLSAKKQKAIRSPFFTELDTYNGVVTPSKLEPGEAPRVPSWSKGQQLLSVGAECPICGVRFGRNGHLQQHFVACAKKNGNPDGRYWDELLEDQ